MYEITTRNQGYLTVLNSKKIYLRFWSVEWIRWMSDVLSAMKYSESQASQKISRWQISSHRSDLKSSLLFQINTDVLQLGNIVWPIQVVYFQFAFKLKEFRSQWFPSKLNSLIGNKSQDMWAFMIYLQISSANPVQI